MLLKKADIDKIFEDGEDSMSIILSLFRLLHPNFDKVKKFHGYPTCSKDLNLYLTRKFISFDTLKGTKSMNGGVWLNNGWSSLDSEGYKEWEARPVPMDQIEYQEEGA